jgi:hypothetical protein
MLLVGLVVFGLGREGLARHGVAAAEPAAEIDVGASRRAERAVV